MLNGAINHSVAWTGQPDRPEAARSPQIELRPYDRNIRFQAPKSNKKANEHRV